MAYAIAGALSHYEVTFFPVELTFSGSLFDRINILNKYHEGDLSLLKTDLNSIDAGGYDLIMIGMPTIGAKPPKIYYDIIAGIKNLGGKNIVLFGTSRIYRGEMLNEMRAGVEAKGGRVVNQINFKGLFGLWKSKGVKYGKMIDSLVNL